MTRDEIFKGEAIGILARTIYGEARGQPREGKEAVASVIRNRVQKGGWWGNDIMEVCLWPFQFSAWNDRDPNNKIMLNAEEYVFNTEFQESLAVAVEAVEGTLRDNTNNSTHYINPRVADPVWARGLEPAVTIGAHVFYNNVR